MNHSFELIVITTPHQFMNEHLLIRQLYSAGLQKLHIRKPGLELPALRKWIGQLPEEIQKISVIHEYYILFNEFKLAGVHFQEKQWRSFISSGKWPQWDEKPIISVPVHSRKEIEGLHSLCDYMLLSPVFNSISKSNRKASNEWESSISSYRCKKIALGGINENNVHTAFELGFNGVATLGCIWNNPDKAIEHFNHLKNLCQQVSLTY